MITVRPFQSDDKPAIEAMHTAMGFDYKAPEWGELMLSAVVDVDGEVTSAGFLRQTAEAYWVFNPDFGRRRDRLAQLLMLHRELLIPAKRMGLADVHSWPPPQIEPQFGKILLHLGWQKPLWPCYSREVK